MIEKLRYMEWEGASGMSGQVIAAARGGQQDAGFDARVPPVNH
jgi:hypothetical protein